MRVLLYDKNYDKIRVSEQLMFLNYFGNHKNGFSSRKEISTILSVEKLIFLLFTIVFELKLLTGKFSKIVSSIVF